MRNIGLLTIIGIQDNLRLKTPFILYCLITIMLLVVLAAFLGIFLISPELNSYKPDIAKLELYLGLIMYSASVLGLGVYLNSWGYASIIREKSRGNIQSLLATMVNIKDIWMGKSMAVFIPGLILGELLALVTLIIVNHIYFVPEMGFLFNPWIAVSSFIAVPIIYFCLGLLVNLISLTGKPANAMLTAQVFLPLLLSGVINLLLRTTILDINSWSFAAANMGIAAVIAIIVIFLQFRINKEKVVLSCK
ncbi:hypothetical protein ACFLQS_01870 [Actinomycetota bacterium]